MSGQPEFEKTFTATDDQGQRYTVDVFVDLHSSGQSVIPGQRTIRIRNETPVCRLDRGKYQTGTAGLILHSDDPEAR